MYEGQAAVPIEVIFLTNGDDHAAKLIQNRFANLMFAVQSKMAEFDVALKIKFLSYRYLMDVARDKRRDAMVFYISENPSVSPSGRRRFPTAYVESIIRDGFYNVNVIDLDGSEDAQVLNEFTRRFFSGADRVEDQDLDAITEDALGNPLPSYLEYALQPARPDYSDNNSDNHSRNRNNSLVHYSNYSSASSSEIFKNNRCTFFSGANLGLATSAAVGITLGSLIAAGVIAFTPLAITALAATAFLCVCFLLWHVGGLVEKAAQKSAASNSSIPLVTEV